MGNKFCLSILIITLCWLPLKAESWNFDDYDDLIAYAVYPNAAYRGKSRWAKEKLKNLPAAIPRMYQALESIDPRVHYEIRNVLSEMGKPVADYLNKVVSDTTSYQNLTAIYVLGQVGETSSLQMLRPLLKSQYPAVRVQTLKAISNIDLSENREVLKEAVELLNDTFWTIRNAVVAVLGKQGSRDIPSIETLFDCLEDTHPMVRLDARYYLQKVDTIVLLPLWEKRFSEISSPRDKILYLQVLDPLSFSDDRVIKMLKEEWEKVEEEIYGEWLVSLLMKWEPSRKEEWKQAFRERFGRDPLLSLTP